MAPVKCSKIIKTQGIFTKPKDLTDLSSKQPKKPKPKNNIKKANLETYIHLIRQIMDDAPDQDINNIIMDMEEHYDLNEFDPF